MFDGLWVVAVTYLGQAGVVEASQWGVLTEGLAVVLILGSLLCMVGPRRVFYVEAVVTLFLAASIVVAPTPDAIAFVTLGITAVAFVLSATAARWEPRVSEQSHPMNLPVFG